MGEEPDYRATPRTGIVRPGESRMCNFNAGERKSSQKRFKTEIISKSTVETEARSHRGHGAGEKFSD